MHSREQILHALTRQGTQIMMDSSPSDRAEFEHKLVLLQEQWQNVVRRANQRKAIIDNNVLQWQMYNDQSQKLHRKLDEMEDSVSTMDFRDISLKRLGALLEQVKVFYNHETSQFFINATKYIFAVYGIRMFKQYRKSCQIFLCR